MCLSWINPKLKTEVRGLEVLSDGYIWLWKVFYCDADNYLFGDCYRGTIFYEGKNTASCGKIESNEMTKRYGYYKKYPAGFHCFINYNEARQWKASSSDRTIMRVKVKPEWIVATGNQICYRALVKVIVCKHIII